MPDSGDRDDIRVIFTDGSTVPIETLGVELKAASADRASVFWTENNGDNIHAAIVGRCFPADAGTPTFAYKTLNGVAVSSKVTNSAQTKLDANNINYYITIGGQNVTLKGKVSSGEFIDIIRSIDWMTARIQENVFAYLASADKIPYLSLIHI